MTGRAIGVYGSATPGTPGVARKAREIGAALARHRCTVVTGACSGLPYEAARSAAADGAAVWGFSPMPDLEGQRSFTPHDDLGIYARLVFVPRSLDFASDLDVCKKYRNVVSTAACDGAIVIAGRWGTLHEFCSLVDFGKVVGVLTGTGEVAEELPRLCERIHKETRGIVLFDERPDALVEAVLTAIRARA
jgi:predicted Rossmann-fold nucleotide-binding protein